MDINYTPKTREEIYKEDKKQNELRRYALDFSISDIIEQQNALHEYIKEHGSIKF